MLAKKLTLFTLLNLAIALLIASVPRSFTAGVEYERHRVVFEFIDSLEPGREVSIILGDSRSECCLEAEKHGFVNLSIGGSTPVEGYYVLSRILDRGAILDRLVISYSPYHVSSQDTFDSSSRYFDLIDFHFIENVRSAARRLEDGEYARESRWSALRKIDGLAPLLPDDLKFKMIDVISLPEMVGRRLREELSGSAPGRSSLVADPRLKLHRAAPGLQRPVDAESREYLARNSRSPVNELYLAKLLSLARRGAGHVAIAFLPMNGSVRQPDESYFERTRALYLEAGYAVCLGPIVFWPNEYFYDASHLGSKGVDRFDREGMPNLRYCEMNPIPSKESLTAAGPALSLHSMALSPR